MSRLIVSLSALLCVLGCSEDVSPTDASTPDAGSVVDGSTRDDAATPDDAATRDDAGLLDAATLDDAGSLDAAVLDSGTLDDAGADAAPLDSGALDSGALDDAGSDAGSACHAHPFGAPAVPIRSVSALSWAPSEAGGGVITPGAYDAIDAQSTATTGMYRATWVFEDASTLAQLQQLTLAAPGPITPRLFTWSTAAGRLSRAETCPGTETFAQDYRVRVEGAETYLDVRQGTALMFTFRRR